MKEYASNDEVELAFTDELFAKAYRKEQWDRVRHAIEFLHPTLGYITPIQHHGWAWSETFHSWGALVTFRDGTKIYTWPKETP